MKILAISNIFPPGYIGGYELGAWELLSALAQKGHTVRVLSSDFLDEAPDFGDVRLEVQRSLQWLTMKHDRWPEAALEQRHAFFNPLNVQRLSSEIRTFRPDVAICFNLMGLGPLSLVHLLDQCAIPTLMYYMDNVFIGISEQELGRYTRIFGQLGSRNSVAVCMSRNLQAEMSEVPGLLGSDVRIIPGWVHSVQPDRKPDPSRRMAKFVFCSRVAGHKGIDVIQNAVEMLVARGVTEFSVDVYGQGEIQQFMQSVKSRGLEEWICYAGAMEKGDMLRKLGEYDALLLPTWEREPFGFVVSEAAAAGCIPVMTARIGAAEWFVDGVDCLKVRRDTEPLAFAMRRIIEMSPAQLCQMQVAAQRVARQSLMFDYWAEVVEGICQELASRPVADRPCPKAVEAAFQLLGDLWLNRPA